jgi:hypothetical protein
MYKQIEDISMGQELLDESVYEREMAMRHDGILSELSKRTDEELLNAIITYGEALDDFEYFKAYSIAVKIKSAGLKPTEKQRAAMLNCLAYRLSEDEV